MTASWMSRRWCVVEHEDQHDLFVGDPWHTHLVDINLRLDIPVERTLCGDLLPARPVFGELLRSILPQLCPQCLLQAKAVRGASASAGKTARRQRMPGQAVGKPIDANRQADLNGFPED